MAENTDGPKFSLAELAEIDVTQVDEIRFEILPKMTAIWKVVDCKLEAIGKDEKPAIQVTCQPTAVIAVVDEAYKDQETWPKLLEKKHNENFFVKEAEDVGRFKAFAIDLGIGIPGKDAGEKIPLATLMEAVKSIQEFPGRIDHRPSKKDPTMINANLRPIVEKK